MSPSNFLLAIVNPSGHDCPYSLQLIICLLLYEITRFLREIFPSLPKLSSLSTTTTVPQRPTPRTNASQPIVESTTDKRTPDYLRADSLASQKSSRSTFSTSSEQPPCKNRKKNKLFRIKLNLFSLATGVVSDDYQYESIDSRTAY